MEQEMGLKILYVGDSPTVPTGFGVVSKNLLKRFHKMGYELAVLGVNHYGDPYNPKEFPFPIWGGDKGPMEAAYGMHKLWSIAAGFEPDVIFFLNDPWVIGDYLKNKPEHINPKIIAYYPTDSGPIKKGWVDMLNSFDAQICYSKYAENVITESNGGIRPPNLHQIYHGVNTTTFFPVSQAEARSNLGLPTDVFIVGMVARNQYRKRFDLLMKGFAEFAKDKSKIYLYLHTALTDIGFDIPDLAEQLGIKSNLITTEDVTPVIGVEESRLNLIYNSFDVNALISLGDGFGLPVAESMAVGCPQLVSDHSCLKELVDGHGGMTVKTAAWMLNASGINTWGGVSDVEDITTKLNQLYEDPALRMKYSLEGYEFIKQEQFTWDYAAERFNQIIKEIFNII